MSLRSVLCTPADPVAASARCLATDADLHHLHTGWVSTHPAFWSEYASPMGLRTLLNATPRRLVGRPRPGHPRSSFSLPSRLSNMTARANSRFSQPDSPTDKTNCTTGCKRRGVKNRQNGPSSDIPCQWFAAFCRRRLSRNRGCVEPSCARSPRKKRCTCLLDFTKKKESSVLMTVVYPKAPFVLQK
jgi:hypothetical protein